MSILGVLPPLCFNYSTFLKLQNLQRLTHWTVSPSVSGIKPFFSLPVCLPLHRRHTISLWREAQVLYSLVHEYAARSALLSTDPSSSDLVWTRPQAQVKASAVWCDPRREHRSKHQWSGVKQAMGTGPSISDLVWSRPDRSRNKSVCIKTAPLISGL